MLTDKLQNWSSDTRWLSSAKSHINNIGSSQAKKRRFAANLRKLLHYLRLQITKADLVSLDIFDTALTRDVSQPVDIFAEVEQQLLAQNIKAKGFAAFRKNAEQELRRDRAWQGQEEITFEQIYDYIAFNCEFSQQEVEIARKLELAIEERSLFAVPDILALTQYLNEEAIPYCFVSDMYLSGKILAKILKAKGFENWQKIIVSCDHKKSKASGSIWSLDYFNKKRILHIGDNLYSDVQIPQDYGITTLYYGRARSAIRASAPLTPDIVAFSRQHRLMTLEAYRDPLFAQENFSRDPQDIQLQRKIMEITGASLGVLLVGSFIYWLRDRVIKKNIDHLAFCARDSWLLKQGWELFNNYEKPLEVSHSYVHLSRKTLAFSTGFLNSSAETLSQSLLDFLSTYYPATTIGKALTYCGLGDPETVELAKGSLKLHRLLSGEAKIRAFQTFLQSQAKRVYQRLEEHYEHIMGYLKQAKLFDYKNLAIVDLGWNGTSYQYLQRLGKSYKANFTMHGFFYGLFHNPHKFFINNGHMEGAFISTTSDHLEQKHALQAVDYLEELHRAPEGTTLGFSKQEGRYLPIQAKIDDAEHSNFKNLISPFQQATLKGLETLLETGSFGSLKKADLTIENAKAALFALFLAPLDSEVQSLSHLNHGVTHEHSLNSIAALAPAQKQEDLCQALMFSGSLLALRYWQLNGNSALDFKRFAHSHLRIDPQFFALLDAR